MWKNIPAVKQGRVINVKVETYWFNDPYSLDYERKELKTNYWVNNIKTFDCLI